MEVAPRQIVTNRLTLRPPVGADRGLWVRLSRDPALWANAPRTMPASDEAAGRGFDDCRHRWVSVGFDLGIVEETELGTGIGIGGVRHDEDAGRHVLSYHFDSAAHGRGLGREAGRAWSAYALEWLPDLPLVALVPERSVASVRTALSLGMERAGTEPQPGDGPDEPESTLFVAPRVESREWFDDETRESALDLWCRVNDTGGAVGFLPGAPRSEVAQALSLHEEEMAEGRSTAVLLRATEGTVVGLGFWAAESNPMIGHARTAYRVMTDPGRRGRNLGRLLLAAMHRVAREQGVELVTVVVRSGLGITRFYERSGYVEVGRVPANIRVGPGDDRDSVYLARRLDGRAMVADGRA